ncbi:MAG: DUF2155 domain-containing protein [Alphaproteobacteria bacterium]|nr:DUF2155 domain-containing protein [Alphaproteobacteria bacterium]
MIKALKVGAVALVALLLDAATAAAETVAVLQGLDKVTARVTTIEAPLDRIVRFHALAVVARECKKKPPEETPEVAVFVEIAEAKPGDLPKTVFAGWMFASSPAVSAMEHPTYDVWAIDCKTR